MYLLTICTLFILGISWIVFRGIKKAQRERFIESYEFPTKLNTELLKKYDQLDEKDAKAVVEGLRCYFHLCHTGKRKMVAMPSQAVDVAWHEFILFTKEYQTFCKHAFGRFLHHVPAESMPSKTSANAGIKTAWRLACAREMINPHSPVRVPTLFGLDARLNIGDGFHYDLDCTKTKGDSYCVTHIGCAAGCGSSFDTDSDSDSGSSCGSSCSSCGGGD